MKIKNAKVIAIAIAVCHFLFTFANDFLIFRFQGEKVDVPYTGRHYILAKILIFCFLLYFWGKVINITVTDIKGKKFTLIYGGVVFVFLVLLWPGVWRWDDLIILKVVAQGGLYGWQHWLSSFFDLLCLQLIPIPGGIVIVQAIIATYVSGLILDKLYERFNTNKVYLLTLFFCMPAVIDSVFYPIRSTVCAYLELYVFFVIFCRVFWDEDISAIKWIWISFLIGICASWRPENIVHVVFIPVILWATKKITMRRIVACILICITITQCVKWEQNHMLGKRYETNGEYSFSEKEKYLLSGIIQPLGELIKGETSSPNLQDDLEVIDRVISVDYVKETSGLYAFWNGGLKDVSEQNMKELKIVYIKLVIFNFPKFFRERMLFFMKTNGFGKDLNTMSYYSAHLFDDYAEVSIHSESVANEYQFFREHYVMVNPIFPNVRKIIVSMLEMKNVTDWDTSSSPFLMIFYNVIIILLAMVVSSIREIKRKKYISLFFYLAIIAKLGIVILAAPSTLFMYVFSTYLIGGTMVIVLWITNVCDGKLYI